MKVEGSTCSDCPSPDLCATPPISHCFRTTLPFYIFTTRENQVRPGVFVTYRLIVGYDGTIGSFCYTHETPTRYTKWNLLYLNDTVYPTIIEMLAKAFANAHPTRNVDPQITEEGQRFLSVTV